jgi:hypothetical protein
LQLPQIPFELLIFILFFVLPALSSLIRRLARGTGQKGQTAQSKQPAQSTRPTRADTTLPQDTPGSTPAPDWLEQARRRVAEARQQEGARGSSAQNPTTRPQTPPLVKTPQARSTARPGRERGLEGQSLETRRVSAQSLEGASLEGRSIERSAPELLRADAPSLSEAPPIHVQRAQTRKRATITGSELRFDAHDIAKGLIWHQVLSPPRSTLRRTRLSRRQP